MNSLENALIDDCWIQTYSGKRMNPFNPTEESIDIIDIAHALSLICRFTGHCKTFYSVGEHSLRVAEICDHKLAGLLHDATEAYLCDLSRPLKRMMPEYEELEKNVCGVIFKKFGLEIIGKNIYPPDVNEADNILLSTEKRDLLANSIDWDWNLPDPLEKTISPVQNTKEIEDRFLDMFSRLTAGQPVVPNDYYLYHHKDCNKKYRGCSTECPKDIYEETGIWNFPKI